MGMGMGMGEGLGPLTGMGERLGLGSSMGLGRLPSQQEYKPPLSADVLSNLFA